MYVGYQSQTHHTLNPSVLTNLQLSRRVYRSFICLNSYNFLFNIVVIIVKIDGMAIHQLQQYILSKSSNAIYLLLYNTSN